jgi:hypothetical protein
VQRKADKKRQILPWKVRRMDALGTNQIMPKHSLENLATISKLKYFGHTMHSSDSMKKYTIIGLTDGSGKLERQCTK